MRCVHTPLPRAVCSGSTRCSPLSRFLTRPALTAPTLPLPLLPFLLPSSSSVVGTPRPTKHRSFTCTPASHLRTTELTAKHFTSLRANADRLWSDIHHTSQWGQGKRYGEQPEQTGMSRLTLSDADRKARAWFVSTTEKLGCRVWVDGMGNQFAIRPGRSTVTTSRGDGKGKDEDGCKSGEGFRDDIPATFAGSHLDTQPTGGRFDGVLGVCAGIEMLRLLEENWIETEGAVGVVNWTNEEGARFSRSMMGSGVWSGKLGLEETYALKEVGGGGEGGRKNVKQELERIGALGQVPANWKDGVRLGAHFELHIEQGPHLVTSGEKVGAVEGVQAYKWFTITVTGRDCHSGTTAFEQRADALYYAAKAIQSVRSIARKSGGLATVGIIKAEPGSVNTVPGVVTFSLDIRHPEDSQLATIVEGLGAYLEELKGEARSEGPGVQVELVLDFDSKAVKFDPTAIECVQEAGKSVTGALQEVRLMTSGAGHDSVFTSMHCPTAMIFAPCRDGVSHHPAEWCEKEDCAIGASVLTEAVLRFDRIRHERGDFT